MSTVQGGAFKLFDNPNVMRDAAVGGGAGLLLGRPIMGALAGLAYNLFSTEGAAEGMKAAAGKAFESFNAGGGVQDIVSNLGGALFGDAAGGQTRADPEQARLGAQAAEKKSGIPGWAKVLGLGVGGLALFNNVFDRFSMNGFSNPLFAGAGMFPGVPGMGFDPMSMMMGGGMGVDPMSAMMMGGGGMAPTNNIIGGMGIMDLLLVGGGALAAKHFMSR